MNQFAGPGLLCTDTANVAAPSALLIEDPKRAELARSAAPLCEPGPLELSLQDEVEMLRRRIAELEDQNRTLHSQVAHEAELKERYRQELADLRRRGHTPR
ncbi:SULTR2 [Symbiodinium natans]|uniref:SULTR2 protein n=1 Tax=Symbiodinium natans TaxID=878477 RepID=A0A812RIR9_9DINO|nr:SULTR2 [Symbiodinium natans]